MLYIKKRSEVNFAMELYGRDQGRNNGGGSQPGQQQEWSPTGVVGGQTGLEESMWSLGLAGSEPYPERPGVPDCVYYMRTGFCGYGVRCRYNHPRNRAAVEAAVRATGDYPERPGEPPCQFYLKTRTCKFGASCKFDHPKHGVGSLSHVLLNIHGYPLRPDEKECSYYLKTGQCKFGITCKFHHPPPAGSSASVPAPQFYQPVQSSTVPVPDQYGGTSSSLGSTPRLVPGSYVQGAYAPFLFSPGMIPFPGWSPYSAPVSPVLSPGARPAVGTTSIYGVPPLSSSTPPTGPYTALTTSAGPSSTNQMDQTFPERPGEPECQYYLKTGDCKFGSSCRYHHPRDRVVPSTNCVLSAIGLPLRPGTQPCAFYLKYGHCKFGSTCKFDHPLGTMRYSPSASSLIDIPVAPYPVGSFFATLSPPSSTELQPKLITGAKSDPTPSSGNSSGSTLGLIFSQSSSIPLSGSQLSGQIPITLISGRSMR